MGGTLPTIAPETLAEALEAAAGRGAELVFHGSDRPVRLPASTLLNEARRGAGALSALGLNRGEAVGILGPNRPEWARWAFATWLAGGVVVPLPYHLRNADRAASAHSLGSLLRAAGCRVALADPGLIGLLPPGSAIGWTIDLPARPGALAAPRPTDRAVVQFTSGSTATPKGVVLSHRAVLAGIRNPASDSGLEEHDRVQLSWLPFFHDWGLFGYLVWSIVMATETHILPTERFAKDPSEWLRLAGRVRALMTPGPSSAWDAALRTASRRPHGIDLSTLRVCTLAAEAIEPRVLDRLLELGGELGLAPDAPNGAYGLAEATLAVTVGPAQERIRVDTVDRSAVASTGVAAS
ncbi:MAG TPA: AMP-binding protein, partial [Actinomycetota bacterium]